MKKLGIILLVICVLVLAVICGSLYSQVNEKELALVEQQTKMEEVQSEVKELEGKIEQAKNVLVENESTKKEEISEGKIDSKKFKVASKKGVVYSKDTPKEYATLGVSVKIDDGKAYVTVDAKNETLKAFSDKVNLNKVKSVTNKELTVFSAKPVEVFRGQFMHEVINEVFFFLMDDGTVEYIKTVDLLNNSSYKSQGKITGLSNVEKFDILSVNMVDGGGYETTVAIDKDGYYYDLNEML